MNLRKLWYLLTILGIIAMVFYLGFLFGIREKVDDKPDQLQVIGPNSSIQNSLTEIETRGIMGSTDSQNIKQFGQFYFKINENQQTEILLRLESVPATAKNSKQEKVIPNELYVALAKQSLDGLDYDYETIGKVIFDEPKNNLRSAQFSTILKTDLKNIERVVLLPEKTEDENLFRDESPDLPPKVRQKAAPYFWVVI